MRTILYLTLLLSLFATACNKRTKNESGTPEAFGSNDNTPRGNTPQTEPPAAEIVDDSLLINDGAPTSASKTVTVKFNTPGNYTHYILSEVNDFRYARWQVYTDTTTYVFLEDGAKTLHAKFIKANGTETKPITASIVVDTAALSDMVVKFVDCEPVCRTRDVLINAKSSKATAVSCSEIDNVFEHWYRLYGGQITFPFTLTESDGAKTVFCSFRDTADRESDPTQLTASLDTTAPPPPVIAGEDRRVNTSMVTLELAQQSSAEDLDYYEIMALNGLNVWTKVSSWPVTIQLPENDRYYQIKIRAVDKAGHRGEPDSQIIYRGQNTKIIYSYHYQCAFGDCLQKCAIAGAQCPVLFNKAFSPYLFPQSRSLSATYSFDTEVELIVASGTHVSFEQLHLKTASTVSIGANAIFEVKALVTDASSSPVVFSSDSPGSYRLKLGAASGQMPLKDVVVEEGKYLELFGNMSIVDSRIEVEELLVSSPSQTISFSSSYLSADQFKCQSDPKGAAAIQTNQAATISNCSLALDPP